ncbi:MAG: aminoacyl-tRNA hydrolase [Crocinitomicaceae bacterium]|nr:aminoacyl-tRNA hydrolase [Crocinitomicaceae bacterium]
MKYLVVGLGNPGAQYDDTRHNIGFDVLNRLAKDAEAPFKVDRLCEKTEVKYKGRTIILIKPTTFMNLSGKAVQYWLQKEKIPLDRLLVISDDLALPFGKLRLKPKGSDGGHNGLKDIQNVLQTQLYNRLRFGVGSEFAKGRQSDFVLGKWSDDEFKQLEERLELCIDFIKSFTTIGVSMTMSALNGK